MSSTRYWVALFTIAAVGLAAAVLSRSAGGAAGQGTQAQPLKIVVVSPARIIKEMQETKELEARLNSEVQRLAAEERDMKEKIKKLEDQRGNFRPDSPQYDDLQRQYIKAVAEWKVWGETFMAERDWRMKKLTRMLFDKVQAAISEYASREGIDVVISDFQPQATDKQLTAMSVDQLRDFLNQRRVLFSSKQADISDAIIARLDSKYRAEGGGATLGALSGDGAPAIPSAAAAAGGGGTGAGAGPNPNTGATTENARPAASGAGQGTQRRPNNR